MARVWRDGQKKTCYIYRLICTGTIEEKILQRQMKKLGFASAIGEDTSKSGLKLSHEDLQELFKICPGDDPVGHCDTQRALSSAESTASAWRPYAGHGSLGGIDAALCGAAEACGGGATVTYVSTVSTAPAAPAAAAAAAGAGDGSGDGDGGAASVAAVLEDAFAGGGVGDVPTTLAPDDDGEDSDGDDAGGAGGGGRATSVGGSSDFESDG
jgi:hypothetical protein